MENELALAIIACSSDLNADHKFRREDRLRVLVCVFVLACYAHPFLSQTLFIFCLFCFAYKFGFV